MNTDKLAGQFLIYDAEGNQLFKLKTTAIIGDCAISNDSKFCIFETYQSDTDDSDKIFVIDVIHNIVLNKFESSININEASIDSNNQCINIKINEKLFYQLNFEGKLINKEKFEKDLNNYGSDLEKIKYYIILYEENETELFKIDSYLNALMNSSNDPIYKDGNAYKRIGEIYEYRNNIENAIKYYQLALDSNPKIGVKMKLARLLKLHKH
jgi:tetratricopeptide (TPR) repeat protein